MAIAVKKLVLATVLILGLISTVKTILIINYIKPYLLETYLFLTLSDKYNCVLENVPEKTTLGFVSKLPDYSDVNMKLLYFAQNRLTPHIVSAGIQANSPTIGVFRSPPEMQGYIAANKLKLLHDCGDGFFILNN